MRSPFYVEVTPVSDRVVVRPVGDLDLATAGELEDALLVGTDGNRQLIVDLRGLSFMDSVGLDALIRAARRAATHGIAFRMVRGSRTIDRLFDLTDTRSHFDFVDLGVEVDPRMPESALG